MGKAGTSCGESIHYPHTTSTVRMDINQEILAAEQSWVEAVISRSSISKFSAQLKGRTHTWKGFAAQLKTAALSNPALQA